MVRRNADVDDVLQETNTVLWRKREEFDWEQEFIPWACQIAKFQALAFFKRLKKQDFITPSEEVLNQIVKVTIQNSLHSKPNVAALNRCLQKLSSQQRELVEKRYTQSIPVHQIALEQGRSADAVSMTLYRIRKSLLECIQNTLSKEF